MKKILSILITLMLVLLCSCKAKENSAHTTSAEVENITPDTIEVYIRTEYSLSTSDSASNANDVGLASAAKQGIIEYYSASNITVDNVSPRKTIEMFGETYNLDYINSKIQVEGKPTNNINRIFHEYRNSSEGVHVVVDENEQIIAISDRRKRASTDQEKTFTDEEIVSSANEYFKEIIPQEYFDEYSLLKISQLNGQYKVFFSRNVHGYRFGHAVVGVSCLDKQFASFTMEFDINASAKYYENKFTKQYIDAVAAALRQKIDIVRPEYDAIYDPTLAIDHEGRLYIWIQTTYDQNKFPYGIDYYALIG